MHITTKELEGRDHFVVPSILMVTGVLNGSNGPLYYPADEIERSAHLWDGKPVVVYHPDMLTSGRAGNPTVFNRQKVGVVFNARFDGKRLRADAWIDVQRVKQVDSRVLDAIQSHTMMELSTGLFTDTDTRMGTHNGRHYDATVCNYRPDHLALLPDKKGACSLADGAGFIRLNAEQIQEPLLCPTMF